LARGLLILILLLCSCATTVRQEMISLPHSELSFQIKSSDDVPDAKRVSQAITIFYHQWRKRFGDRDGRVKNSIDEIMIEWSSKDKILTGMARDIKGRLVRIGQVKGMTLGPTYIWLRTNSYDRVASTSLVHELTHVALWANGCRSGDPDHEGDLYLCWTREHTQFVSQLNRTLAELDI